jgi:hypothetical protein
MFLESVFRGGQRALVAACWLLFCHSLTAAAFAQLLPAELLLP